MDTVNLNPGTLWYQPAWLSGEEADRLFAVFYKSVAWQSGCIMLFGKRQTIPRLQAWYGDKDACYSYSGLSLTPLPWFAELQQLRERIATQTGYVFNSVLANLYRDGRDSNGWHADNEPELGEQPVIASVSLGAVRRFRLRRTTDKRQTHTIDLEPGSLLVMGPGVQENWQHQLTKTTRAVAPRINLTFRNIQR